MFLLLSIIQLMRKTITTVDDEIFLSLKLFYEGR